ncbi:hypothetical protein Tco_0715117 [Tanacetum coccineum]
MNTTQAQQKALDDALVTPADHLEFGKCNMRLKTDIKTKEATFQVVLDALSLTPFYQAFLITTEICLKIPRQWFKEPPPEHDILSFLRDLGHSRDIHYITDKAESDTSPKKKTSPATKGSRLKSSTKVAKIDRKKQPATMPKTKGLAVLSEVALTKAEQIKLATKRSKKDLHMSHASGSGDGVDIQSKVPDKQQQKVTGTNEGAGVRPESSDEDDVEESDLKDNSEETEYDNDGDNLTHPNLATYKEDDKEEEQQKADDEEMYSDQRVSTPPEYELTKEEEENKEGDDKDKKGEQEQDEEDDLYRDVNINLERSDAEMTDAQANKDTEDAHVTLIVVPLVVQQQSSSVSSDLVSKVINPSPDTGIVDNYLASKMKDAVDVVVQLQTNKLREEAQAENHEFLNQVDSTIKAIIKEQVQAQVSKIMPKIEKYVTESLGAERGLGCQITNLNLESYRRSSFAIRIRFEKRSRDDQDKDEDPSVGSNRGSKRRRSDLNQSLQARLLMHQKVDDLEDQTHQEFNTGNDDVTPVREALEDASQWNPPSSPTPDYERHKTKTAEKRPPQPWISQLAQATGIQSSFNEILATPIDFSAFIMNRLKIDNLTQERFYGYASNMESSYDVYSRHKIIAVTSLKIREWFGYSHLEEIIVRRKDDKLYKFREGNFKRLCRQDIQDMLLLLVQDKLSNINLEERYALNVALRMFTRRIIIQEQVEDLKLGVESYQKKINLTRPNTYRSHLRRMTPYTAYPDIQGIIYEDEMNRNRLKYTDELHKFSDGTQNHVRTALNDIDRGIDMDYLPKRK